MAAGPSSLGLVAGGLGAVVLLGGLLVLGERATRPPMPSQGTLAPSSTTARTVEESELSTARHEDDLAARFVAQATLDGAFRVGRASMTDVTNGPDSEGSDALAMWLDYRGRWADVGVDTDETNWTMTEKDPEEARGKRLCVSGTIVEIRAVSRADVKVFVGEIMSGAGNVFRFNAAGSTGDLVAGSWGRICGMVVGLYDYSNSVGGMTHAVAMAGMFDLPANRKRTAGAVPLGRKE